MTSINRRAKPLLGTFVEIGLRSGNAALFDMAFSRIEEVQQLMSAHSVDSDLSKIARTAHHEWVTVHPSTAEVIRHSLKWAEASDAAFDPIRAGVELIHRGRRPWFMEELPDRNATWRDLEVDECHVRSTRPIALDLGGIAKGYAVDQAAEIIAGHGCDGIVNAGGDIRFIGNEERTAFIRKPDVAGGLLELREIPLPALATTASYVFPEEAANLDLIDSKAGGLVLPHISITVVAATCMLADAMTKVVLNLPADRAAVVLKRLDCHALLMESGGPCREIP